MSRRARPIMIQGTMSGAGKSLLVTALCRIFKQDGYAVAPFKSQNMALNSYVTLEGLEMGRAQVAQAEAAGREPDVRMNPVLLKPSSDTGSQVIVCGEIRGFMSAQDYFSHKTALIPEIMKAYNSLAAENDILVLEGAGSPAEINLKENDIVNMGLAELADAPVLLAGDIDRGGVFAQLYGTWALLEEKERARLKGFIINKFRGDADLLTPGLIELTAMTGVPVQGVVPYVRTKIDEEDSLSELLLKRDADRPIDIAVIRLPRLSNFTDFTLLTLHPALSVRYVSAVSELGRPDLIILPGTKNTTDDLKWLYEKGLAREIKAAAATGLPVLGICGGYQMLGRRLLDPEGLEGEEREIEGLSLLPGETVFKRSKIRTRVRGRAAALFEGAKLTGYEIHSGVTSSEGEPFCVLDDGRHEGCVRGNVFGTYLHGLFDTGELTAGLAVYLAQRKGMLLPKTKVPSKTAYMDREYDRLADTVRAALDMDAVYDMLERMQIC